MITLEPMENLRLVAKYRYHKELDDLTYRDWANLSDYIGFALIHRWGLSDYIAEQTRFNVPKITLTNTTYTFNSGSIHANANAATFNFKVKI